MANIIKTKRPTFFLTPKKFKTAAELEVAIQNYIENPINVKIVVDEKGVETEVPIYTITGLALSLGYADRMSIYDWKYKINDENEENRKMAELMIKASKFVESNYESNLQTNHATGSIFALKNMGWKDNQDHNHTGNIVVGYEYKNKDTQDFDQLED